MSLSIRPTSRIFTDVFGNTLTNYYASAGALTSIQFDLEESIYCKTDQFNTITSDVVLTSQKKLRLNVGVQTNGFDVGQNVTLKKTKPNGTTVTVTTTIVSIVGNVYEFGALFTPANENIYLYDNTNVLEIYSTDLRKDLDFFVNFRASYDYDFQETNKEFSPNLISLIDSDRNSLIDGTKQAWRLATTGVIVGGSATGTQQGYKSGGFAKEVSVVRQADVNSYTRLWRFTFTLFQDGILLQDFFNSNSNGLSLLFDLQWYSDTNEDVPSILRYNFFAGNTSWYNQGYANAQPDAYLTSLLTTPLQYNGSVTNTITIESNTSQITIGASYIPQDSTYNSVKYLTQTSLCMHLFSLAPLSVTTYTSASNETGAQYEIEIISHSYVGTTHTIEFRFSYANQEFIDFMDSRALEDRVVYIWFQSGNTSVLVNELTLEDKGKDIDTLNPYLPVFRTDKITNNYPADTSNLVASTEDNIILFFQSDVFKKDVPLNECRIQLMAKRPSGGYFTLEQTTIDLSNVLFDVSGTPQFSVGQTISEYIPTTALNRKQIILNTKSSTPSPPVGNYTISFNIPFVFNWRYWIPQLNAPIDFEPNQNKDYLNYFSIADDIIMRVEVENLTNIYTYDFPVNKLLDYDEVFSDVTEEWQGTTEIEYYIDSTNEQTTALIQGEVMRVLVRVNTNQTATASSFWGMLTIEPFENSPRWALSSNYNTDNNPDNPIKPLVGETTLKRTLVGGLEVTYEALIDTNLLSLGQHKITLKHYNNSTKVEQVRTKFEVLNIAKNPSATFESETEFTDEIDGCCRVFDVFAESVVTDNNKNDVTALWKLLSSGDSVVFELYKDDVLKTTISQTVFPNQSNAVYGRVVWRDILTNYGVGCYEVKLKYTSPFGAITYTSWGKYKLQEWTLDGVRGMVQIRAFYNQVNDFEEIDFTDVNLQDCVNVQGFFGNRDPKRETDNVVYSSKLVTTVSRENVNEYQLNTDPIKSNISQMLIDIVLLQENKLIISDWNEFNHVKYRAIEVVCEGVEVEYLDYSNKAKVNAKFGDRFKNRKAHY